MMRGVPCGICSPHREHFAETGIPFASYLVCRFGTRGIIWIVVPHFNINAFSLRGSNIGCFGSVCETRSAHHRSALRRLEWYSRVNSALRTSDVGFASKSTCRAFPLGFALLAVFGFVDEFLFLKELLFSRRKNKHHTTTYAQDISVKQGHNPPSKFSRFREGFNCDRSPFVELAT